MPRPVFCCGVTVTGARPGVNGSISIGRRVFSVSSMPRQERSKISLRKTTVTQSSMSFEITAVLEPAMYEYKFQMHLS